MIEIRILYIQISRKAVFFKKLRFFGGLDP